MAEPTDQDPLSRTRRLRRELDYAGARDLLRDAVERRLVDGDRVGEAQLLLGRLEEDAGELTAAEAAYTASVSAAEHARPPGRYAVRVRASTRLVSVLRDRGAMPEADAALIQALDTAEAWLPNGLEQADAIAEKSRHALHQGDHDESERLATAALAMIDACPPAAERDESRACALSALGTVLRARGRYSEAYTVLDDALTTAEAAFGPGSLEVGGAHNDLGICGKFSGQFDRGIEHYHRALGIFQSAVGPDHPDVATVYHNLGGILHARRDFDAAEPWARRAVDLRERLLGPDHVTVAADGAALASILAALGRYDEAEDLLRQALACLERQFGPDNHDVIANYGNLAGIARRRGHLAEAERLYRHALAAKQRILGPDHPELATTLNNLAVVSRRQGNDAEAEALYRRAIAIYSATVEPDHPSLTATRENLNRLLNTQPPRLPPM